MSCFDGTATDKLFPTLSAVMEDLHLQGWQLPPLQDKFIEGYLMGTLSPRDHAAVKRHFDVNPGQLPRLEKKKLIKKAPAKARTCKNPPLL